MADGRMLKKKISLNEALADLKNDTHRLLFTWAIPHLDIEGRISGSPRVFKGTVVPLIDSITPKIIREFCEDAHKKHLIAVYEIDGEWVIEFPGFRNNQNLRETREAPSKYPPPPDDVWQTPGVIPDISRTTPLEVNRREGKGREVCGLELNFELFWKAYPRKIAKRDALAAWKKANGKPPIEKILSALEEQKKSDQWTTDNGKYIPHPTTWINKGRWDDEGLDLPKSKDDISRLCQKHLYPQPCPKCKEGLNHATSRKD